ncbi:MAG: hypothetical protein Q8M02_11875 [Candidatus Didemnitutus sp.]|nr:hypothetical protein [Candidatus Didemnitutus sp.]
MKPNPAHEQLSVPEIAAGLVELEKFLGVDRAGSLSPLFPFKVACDVHEQQRIDGFAGLEQLYEIPAFRECVMFIAGALDLVRYFQAARHNSELKKLRRHFALVSDGFFGIAGTYGIQMSQGSLLRRRLGEHGITPPSDAVAKDATRKTIELMLAMAALNTFDGVEVEDPKASDPSNPNPDIIIHKGDQRFGIACKSITSLHEETFKENIAKGVAQLERSILAGKVDSRCGVVMIDVSAILEHDRLYVPEPGYCWVSAGAGPALTSAVTEALLKVFGHDPVRTFHDILGPIFKGHNLPPGVLIYAHGLLICEKDGAIFPVYQKTLRLGFGGDTSFLGSFNESLNRALHCQPPTGAGF